MSATGLPRYSRHRRGARVNVPRFDASKFVFVDDFRSPPRDLSKTGFADVKFWTTTLGFSPSPSSKLVKALASHASFATDLYSVFFSINDLSSEEIQWLEGNGHSIKLNADNPLDPIDRKSVV